MYFIKIIIEFYKYLVTAFTCADTFEEAVFMAKDCLELNLDGIEQLPKMIDIEEIELEKNEYIVMIEADMISYNKK